MEHKQLEGIAFYDETTYEDGKVGHNFMFAPDEPLPENVPRFRGMGMAEQMQDGTFDFVSKPRRRADSELILKLAHGRVSQTKDGAIQLTIKVFTDENINISKTMEKETREAVVAVRRMEMIK